MKRVDFRAWTRSERVTDHLIQGVLIFASVFLAFWLNDYRVGVAERRATEAAMEAVAAEIQRNLAILEQWAPYHRSISERMEPRLGLEPEALEGFHPYKLIDERGIFQEILTDDSWEFLRQSDVRMDIDTRIAVHRVFRQQEYVDGAVRDAVDFLGSRELFDPSLAEQNFVIFYQLITDLYHQQVAMMQTYRRTLEVLPGGTGRGDP